MHVDGVVSVESEFQQPVGRRRTSLVAVLPLAFLPLKVGDLLPDPVEAVGEPGLQGAEPGQIRGQVIHVSSLHQNSNKRSNRAMQRVDHLTDTQERILRVIRQTIADRGEAPTYAEIGQAVGLRSRSSVHYQLGELQAKAAIVRDPGRRRGIRLA